MAGSTVLALPATAAEAAVTAPDISVTNIQNHLSQLQTIATNNGGTRRSTTSGYTASVTYVYDKLVAAGFSVVKQSCTSGCTAGAGPNIIADWPGGDTSQVVMMGAHLDSVSAGPGINDNGSGSSMLLEVALTLAAQHPTLAKHVRFGWWTDEEQGLLGSKFYVNSLPSTEKAKIQNYLNFDMIASTNAGYFINRITSATGQLVKAYYDSIGVQTEENTEGAGRSDDASFNAAGIQTSGIAAGASAIKTSAQATKWGGTAGASYDSCYHKACDTYPSNINTTVLDRAADAAAYALWNLAVSPGTGGGTCSSPGQKLLNPGFESGNVSWSASTGVIDNSTGEAAHSGSWKAWMNGYGTTHTDTLSQSVSIPSGCAATFSFWLHIDTAETTTTSAYDTLVVKAGSTTLATYSNLNKNTGYVQKSFTVPAGTTSVSFTGTEDASLQTSFVIDDTAFTAS
ncbi:MAG: M28 family peptidase [Actinobacteria bacterium]|nr:M28 family peptidase [Actinomycetota bacterium]